MARLKSCPDTNPNFSRTLLLSPAQEKLAGSGTALIVGLDQYRRIGQPRFLNLDLDLGVTARVGNSLGVKGCRLGTRKAKDKASTSGWRASSVTRNCMVKLLAA